MKRLRINFFVGTIDLAALVFLMGTGIFFRLILPSENGKNVSVWGLTRNEWGIAGRPIHLFISAAFFLVPKGKNI
jgi:hypothetical protein